MKITKGRLQEIINEEVLRLRLAEARGFGNETEVGDDVVGRANQDFEMPELVNSWAKEIHKWIESQWSADSDFSSSLKRASSTFLFVFSCFMKK